MSILSHKHQKRKMDKEKYILFISHNATFIQWATKAKRLFFFTVQRKEKRQKEKRF